MAAVITSTTLNATCATTNVFRNRKRSVGAGASSLSADTTSGFDAWSAGTRPHSSAATNEMPSENATTRPSRGTDTFTGSGNAGRSETSSDVSTRASSSPAIPPSAKSSVVSVSNCRTTLPRPAPIAVRTAISRRRTTPLASRTPARFAHAITSTTATIDISSVRKPATMTRSPDGMGDEGSALQTNERSVGPRPGGRKWYFTGNSRASAAPIAAISADACALDTPRFKRPPSIIQSAPRVASNRPPDSGFSAAIIDAGTQTSGATTVMPRNPSRATPATLNGYPFRYSVRPTTPGSD